MTAASKTSLFALATLVLAMSSPTGTEAQDFERQAKDILKLYEEGQTDTAYWLIEPLKKNARFVPAALYVRAQMTPDDRALNLYREVIALEPGGAWADEAAYQLVRRYIAKADSMAAWTWFAMLKTNYPQSPYLPKAQTLLDEKDRWELFADESDDEAMAADDFGMSDDSDSSETSQESDDPASDASEDEAESDEFEGYALQVGVLPTRSSADRLRTDMRHKGLETSIFPKSVDGKTQYAVVVGPYDTQQAAQEDRDRVRAACECGAFIVIVEE